MFNVHYIAVYGEQHTQRTYRWDLVYDYLNEIFRHCKEGVSTACVQRTEILLNWSETQQTQNHSIVKMVYWLM